MNPDSMAGPVRLSTDWMFRLPTVVRPSLLDAMSFEATETALARLLGGVLPATGARPAVTGPGGPSLPRPGDIPPVRSRSPLPGRTGRDHDVPRGRTRPGPAAETAPSKPAADYPQWTRQETPPDTGLPVTRLGRGASALADVLRTSAAAPLPDDPAQPHTPSTEDTIVRPGSNPAPEHEAQRPASSAGAGHHELGGSGSDASGPAHPTAVDTPDDSWPEQETEALAGAVLDRLLDDAELDFQRSYGLGER